MKQMTVAEASRIFRAMHGDKEAEANTRIEEVINMIPAETFGEFLLKNNIQTYEEVIRK